MIRDQWHRPARAWANLPLHGKALVVVALPLFALLVLATSSVLVLRQSNEADARVAHTLDVLTEIQRTTTLLLDAQTGARSYYLTGRQDTLHHYLQAQAALPESLDRLAALTTDNPEQVARLRRVRELTAHHLATLEALRASAGPSGAPLPSTTLLTANDEAIDAVRAELEAMQATEQALLVARTGEAEKQRGRGVVATAVGLPVGLLGGGLATLLFITGVVGRVRRLEENAARLARRAPLLAQPASDDEIGQLGRGLEDADRLLAARERELNEARSFREHLIAASPGLIYRVALDGLQSRYISPNVERLLGYTPDEVVNASNFWRDTIHPDDFARAGTAVAALLDGRLPQVECEQRLSGKDGRYRWFYTLMRLEQDGDDAPTILLTYSVDITARKEAEEALLRAKEDLEQRVAERTGELRAANERLAHRQRELEELATTLQAQTIDLTVQTAQLAETNRDLAQKSDENEMFVYSVSHDLRSPLVNLQGFSQELALVSQDLRALLLAEEIPSATRQRALALLDEDMAPSLRFIQAAVSRLGAIIDALLRLSRAGRLEYQWHEVDLVATVGRIVDALHETIEARGAQVTLGDLPPAWGDPTALEQVFANLIGNALAYLSPDRPGQIEVGWVPPGAATRDLGPEFHTYCVRDNGLGIPEHARDKVFQIFQRLHPQVAAGEGLGLALVRRIVERHQGSIWIESVEGAGSAFYVALPHQPEGIHDNAGRLVGHSAR